MKQAKIFKRYIQIADVLGQIFQGVLEVVVHDFKDLDHSIIHIVNGQISGRTVGECASELGIRRLLENEDIPDELVNYTNRNSLGQKLKSASIAIRDDSGKMIGAFCLNFDVSHFEQFQKFLEFFLRCEPHTLVGVDDITPTQSNADDIQQEIEEYLLRNNLYSSQLTYKEKQGVVDYLYKRGSFKKRGAISIVANSLQLTRQCIYNYLDLAKNQK
jgi:predicted transcriptional regulator YheO